MSKSNNKKRVFHILIGLVLILIISAGGVAYGLLWQGNLSDFKVNPAINVINKVTLAGKTGLAINLKSEDLNGILELYLKKKNSQGALTIKAAYSKIQNDKLSFYIPVSYKNFNFLLYSSGSLSYDNNKIVFKPSSFKIGKINIPVTFALNKLKSYNSKFNISEKAIELPKDILPFNITDLNILGDEILVKIQIIKPATGSSKTSSENLQKRINVAILKAAKDQLVAVYSFAETQREKQVVLSLQTIVGKIIKSASYSYMDDASLVKASYDRLTTNEKTHLNSSLLTNMDRDTLLYLKTALGL